MKASLDRYWIEKYAWHRAMIVQCVNKMTREKPLEYKNGVTEDDVKKHFQRLMRIPCFDKIQNRMRGCVIYDKTMRRHDVIKDGRKKRHFYTVANDEEGQIDHTKCCNCERRGVAT